MRKAEARLIEEHHRIAHYVNASTEPKLRAIVEQELVQKHATTLVEVSSGREPWLALLDTKTLFSYVRMSDGEFRM